MDDPIRSDRDCPEPGQLAGFAEDRLLPREREAIEAHLVRCDDCRSFVALPRAPKVRLLRPWRVFVPLAAAAALLIFVLYPARTTPITEDTLVAAARAFAFRPLDRAERVAPALLPKRGGALPLLRPAGRVLEARPSFRWEPVPGIDAWEVSLLTIDGTLLWTERGAVSSLPFPAGREPLRPGTRYLFEVRGEGPLGTEKARRVFAVASDAERAAFEKGNRDIDARAPAALRSLLKAHLALRAGLPAEAEGPGRAALAASPVDPIARETLDRILEDLGEAPR